MVVVEEGRLQTGALLESIVMLTVLLSTVAHGVTAYPAARRYGALVSKSREHSPSEHRPAPNLPTRARHVEHGLED